MNHRNQGAAPAAPQPARDLTFSAPMSVSVVHLFCGDSRVGSAPAKAARAALDFVRTAHPEQEG